MQRRSFVHRLAAGAGAAVLPGILHPHALRIVQRAGRRLDGVSPAAAVEDEAYWREIQQAFSISRSILNLDNGNVCPSPRIVTQELVRTIWEIEEAPAYMLYDLPGFPPDPILSGLARLLGCSPGEVAITRNATEALDTVLLGVPLERGDEVLTTTNDYWAMLDALEQRRDRDGIVLKMIPVPVPARSQDELAQAFEKAMGPRTKLILVSHPVNLTGQLFPIKRICDAAHARGIEVVVDAAQSFGLVDYKISDLGCDYLGTSLHKWLLAPIGTGMLYMKKEKIAKVWPLLPSPVQARGAMYKFMMIGTFSPAPYLAISEALAFHNGIGPARKEARLRYLTKYWTDQVADIPGISFLASFAPEMSCGIATFQLPGVKPKDLRRYLLERHSIVVQSIGSDRAPEVHGLRVTPNVYTTLEELDRFTDVLHQVARKGIPAG